VSGILIIAEQRRGELRPATLELVSAAQGLRASGPGGSGLDRVMVAVIAAEPARLLPALQWQGIDEIITVRVPSAEFDPDTLEAAVAALVAARSPELVLVPHSVDSFGYAAALAAKHGYGFATDVFRLHIEDGELIATRGGYGQKVNVEVDFPGKATVLLALRSNVFKPPESAAAPAVSSFEPPGLRSRLQSRSFIEMSSGDDVDMSAAAFILSIGRGIGEQTNVERFRELAERVGATLGCSRPIADAGWLPKSRQVGQSGKTASACRLYVAMGISGAIQHLAGMKHVSTIVAVNSDAGASIFSIARYGIVADIFDIADELQTHF
jgi:electron transfer flavoprotein alpha subunit